MTTPFDQLQTARQIARALRVPLFRVDYAIQRLGVVESARVGIVRLFDPAAADAIRSALAQIQSRRLPRETNGEAGSCILT